MIIDISIPVALSTMLSQALAEYGPNKLAAEIVLLLNEQPDFKLAFAIREAVNLHITENS